MSDTKVKIEQKNRILFGIMTASQIQPLHFPVQIAALLTYRYIQRKKWTRTLKQNIQTRSCKPYRKSYPISWDRNQCRLHAHSRLRLLCSVTMAERAGRQNCRNSSIDEAKTLLLPESAFVYHKLDPVILALNREYFVITTGRNPLTSF